MRNSRLAILAGLAVVIAIIAATQTCRDRTPKDAPAEPVAKAEPKGVSPRGNDTPMDLRERDRLREGEVDPAGVVATPSEPPPVAEPTAPPPEKLREAAENPEPAVAVAIPGSPTVEAAMAAAKAAAQGEVEKVKGEMRSKCWDTVDRGGKSEAKLSFELSFGAEGQVLASAVQQTREGYIAGLDRCLAPFAHGLAVPAPGEPVSVEVDVELP